MINRYSLQFTRNKPIVISQLKIIFNNKITVFCFLINALKFIQKILATFAFFKKTNINQISMFLNCCFKFLPINFLFIH